MADVNRGNRPLSPFMIGQVYRPQITSVLSILHRITGVAISFVALLVVWWFLAAATSPHYFGLVDWILTSWLGTLMMLGALAALWFHFCNGIRHLFWDAGYGFEIETVQKSGMAVVVATAVLTVITILIAL